jgi:glycerol-3-phosphate dehydrogenase (NAD(P)+)
VALGAKSQTFNGLSGLGDLVLTCSDDLSRNRRFGKQLANNQSAEQALKNVGSTVEGLNTLALVLSIAQKNKIEMPICEQISQVINGKTTPTKAVNYLMSRVQIQE